MTRLSVVDEIFLRTHRGLGTPIALQGLWITERPIEPSVLAALHARLATGSLGRRVVSPRVPGARRRWTTDTASYPVEFSVAALGGDDVLRWADHCADDNLDPQTGPGWKLSTAPRVDGGSVLSLVCSHALADAQSLMRAVHHAVHDPDRQQSTARSLDSDVDRSDTVEALTLVSSVIGRSVVAVGALMVNGRRRRDIAEYMRQSRLAPAAAVIAPGPWEPTSSIFTFAADEWDLAARQGGGTPNTLFLAVVASAVRLLLDRDRVDLSVPVDLRRRGHLPEDFHGANNIAMSEVSLIDGDTLISARAKAKEAYDRPMGAPAGFPEELVQIVPDSVAARLIPAPGQRDALCSNIGSLPTTVVEVVGGGGVRVAARAIHPRLTVDEAAAMRTTLSAYLSRVDGNYTLAVVETDPTRVTDISVVDAVGTAAKQWGVTAAAW